MRSGRIVLLAVTASLAASVVLAPDVCPAPPRDANLRFDLGGSNLEPGYTKVDPSTRYTKARGFGFDLGSEVLAVDNGGPDALRGDFCTNDEPFFFSVDLPAGNYNVTVVLGDREGESTTTVKAESRRLILHDVKTRTGEVVSRTFTVKIRNSRMGADRRVKLKSRELGVLHWDDKLTLEFSGAHPCVCAIEIAKTEDAVTVYLAGDSTVTDQTREPWSSWGQMLPRFFKQGVAVANHAESGETLRSFRGENRLEKVLSEIKSGDYLFIQFGHNDQKEKGEGTGAFASYLKSLQNFITEARKKGAIPVLVTPMNRRTFDAAGNVTNSLGDYPEAVRQAAKEQGVPLIDLNAASKVFYEAMGPEGSKKAFVDNTHHNTYGGYELAKCVVEGIKANKLSLSKFLVEDVPPFDPSRPDLRDQVNIPPSPFRTSAAPEGN